MRTPHAFVRWRAFAGAPSCAAPDHHLVEPVRGGLDDVMQSLERDRGRGLDLAPDRRIGVEKPVEDTTLVSARSA